MATARHMGLCCGICACLGIICYAPHSRADEGMWLFNDLPRGLLQANYGFEPNEEWAEHLMLSSVRFNVGGSASFVSSTGLVITNHHVGADTLQKISTADRNYYRDGFHARTLDEEIKAPDLELNQLVSIEDVTKEVNAAINPEMSAQEALMARRAAMSRIERESLEKTGMRSDVVTLYGGAYYHLYRYRKYTDVRLVFAPEAAIAFFGGDADNFEYPRYCLDICVFRVYEHDRPAQTPHFLRFSDRGVGDGELVFVSGNPGRTQRIFTSAALAYQRDSALPFALNRLRRREILLQQFGLEGAEPERRASDELHGVQNSRKALMGMLLGLQDPAFLARKREDETRLLEQVAKTEAVKQHVEAWKRIQDLSEQRAKLIRETADFAGQLYGIATQLVFLAAEAAKPDGERLREYRESNRESLLQQLLSPAPIYRDLEEAILADSLGHFIELRGGDHELVRAAFAGKGPQARAAELVRGSKLDDVAVRRELVEGGRAAIDACQDPMIQLAKGMEPEARRLRTIREEQAEIERQAYARIADATFAVQGTQAYPDATFTLRLAFGTVKGYEEGEQIIPPWTTIGGAFEREQSHSGREPWQLPRSWSTNKERLKRDTPFNFVCTADIIGGNSGSPVVNRAAEFVGIIFDGNIQSLRADYLYSEEQARAVSVDSRAILEALRNVYNAQTLADELGK